MSILTYSLAIGVVTFVLMLVGSRLVDRYAERPFITLALAAGCVAVIVGLVWLACAKLPREHAAKVVEQVAWLR